MAVERINAGDVFRQSQLTFFFESKASRSAVGRLPEYNRGSSSTRGTRRLLCSCSIDLHNASRDATTSACKRAASLRRRVSCATCKASRLPPFSKAERRKLNLSRTGLALTQASISALVAITEPTDSRQDDEWAGSTRAHSVGRCELPFSGNLFPAVKDFNSDYVLAHARPHRILALLGSNLLISQLYLKPSTESFNSIICVIAAFPENSAICKLQASGETHCRNSASREGHALIF